MADRSRERRPCEEPIRASRGAARRPAPPIQGDYSPPPTASGGWGGCLGCWEGAGRRGGGFLPARDGLLPFRGERAARGGSRIAALSLEIVTVTLAFLAMP